MRTSLLGFLAVAAILALPAVAAHGAPETREIDTRVLTDGTASGDYGGPQGAASDGAPDLLVLDVREAVDASGVPMIVFRFIHQLGDPEAGALGLDLSFEANGQSHAYGMQTTDGLAYTSDTFARIDGPFDVGDGTPKAVEGWVPYAAVGVKTGDEISDIRVTSTLDDETRDRMPGTYDLAGNTVPSVPPEDAVPGTFTLQGPANLITSEISVNTLAIGEQETANLTLGNALATIEQFVTIEATAPEGVTVALEADGIALAPNETRTIEVSIRGAGSGEVALIIRSDLGSYRTIVLPLLGDAKTGDDSDVLSGDIPNGGSFQHTFTTVGTFDYHCHPHPWMTAKITIEEAANGTAPETHTVRIVEPDPADGDTWAFEPADLTIQAGDTVAWVNEGSQIHVIMGGVAGEGHHAPGTGHGTPGHHTEEETTNDSKGAPGLGPIAAVAAVALAMAVRRS